MTLAAVVATCTGATGLRFYAARQSDFAVRHFKTLSENEYSVFLFHFRLWQRLGFAVGAKKYLQRRIGAAQRGFHIVGLPCHATRVRVLRRSQSRRLLKG